jgi:hypothetical protein
MNILAAAATAGAILTLGALGTPALAADEPCPGTTAVTIAKADGTVKVVCVALRAQDGAAALEDDDAKTGRLLLELAVKLDELRMQERFDPTDVEAIEREAQELGIDLDALGAGQLSELLAGSHPGGRTSLVDILKAGLGGMAGPALGETTPEQLLGDVELGHGAGAAALPPMVEGVHKPTDVSLYAAINPAADARLVKVDEIINTKVNVGPLELGSVKNLFAPASGDPAKDPGSHFHPGTPSPTDSQAAKDQKDRDDAAPKDQATADAQKKADEAIDDARKKLDDEKKKQDEPKDLPADAPTKDDEDDDTTYVDPDHVDATPQGPLTPIEVEELAAVLVNELQNHGDPLDAGEPPAPDASTPKPGSDPTRERHTGEEVPHQLASGGPPEAPLELQIAPVDPPQDDDRHEPGPPQHHPSDTSDTTWFED